MIGEPHRILDQSFDGFHWDPGFAHIRPGTLAYYADTAKDLGIGTSAR